MYYSVKMFFDNGGGQCYIISVGIYQAKPAIDLRGDPGTNATTMYGLQDGLEALALEDEPTLIVIPEAVKLTSTEYQTLVQAVLLQCERLRDRFAIFDIYDGENSLDASLLSKNRGYFGNNSLKYGAVYYPFLKTTLNFYVNDGETNVSVTPPAGSDATATATVSVAGVITGIAVNSGGTGYTSAPKVVITAAAPVAANLVSLKTPNTALYNFVKSALKEHFVVLPPSGAVAGIYAATDSNRGVWKAPANVSLANVIEPVIKLDNARQDDLNVDATTGKSINAIRAFMGKGTLVWGARTLAGNDNEWRYIPVRRFFSVVEESVKKSTYWAVFEPNDANTWVKVRGSIENYLTQKWREGALAGATPKEAFFVKCGLGITMTAIDILEGRMNVEIGMAVVRPAEFIILKFSHKLQTS